MSFYYSEQLVTKILVGFQPNCITLDIKKHTNHSGTEDLWVRPFQSQPMHCSGVVLARLPLLSAANL
jgi:hypothetical protein